jgi:uroporphyrinogen-III synthase
VRPLVILRPEPGASATAAKAVALGLEASRFPLFAPEPVAWTMAEGAFDALLVTSANAVRLAGSLPDLPVHAVGEASATAARAAGLTVVTTGDGGVEALLGLLPEGLALLHLAGEERIPPVRPRQRITSVTVYRMAELPLPGAALIEGAVVLVHSPAAGRRLGEVQVDRALTRIAAISPSAAAACGNGWAACEAAAEPSDRALLGLAAKLCEEQA